MPAFTSEFVTFLFVLVESGFYAAVLVNAFRRREGREVLAYLLGAYVAAALALQVTEALWRIGYLPQVDLRAFEKIQVLGALLLSFLLVLVARAFLRLKGWTWPVVGAVWALGVILLEANAFGLPNEVWRNAQVQLPRSGLTLGWSVLGWLVFTLAAISILIGQSRHMHQPLHRNRLSYWIPILFLVIANDVILFSGLGVPGNPLRLAAVLVMSYALLTYSLPDSRLIMRRTLIYLITALLIVGFYMASTLGVQPLFRAASNYNPFLLGAATVILLALIFTPLLGLVQRFVDRLLKIKYTDAGRTLHQYSESINNILDVQRLADVAVGILIEAMGLGRGFLFLVDTETSEGGHRAYRLRAARADGERQVPSLLLDENNPIAQHLARDGKTLPQFDIDLLPVFRGITPLEREWFNRLETEVYAPIIAERRWIGMLALGAKLSGQSFSKEEMVTVGALANQTAVALENARLVENLVKLNTELRQAYSNLDKANRDLERLDRTKSDFISIASHELRTPLTVVKGYTEMLLEDRSLAGNIKQVLVPLHKSALRLHEIMDSMFDIAQIDTRTLQLHIQPVDTAALILEVCSGLKTILADRRLSLTIDLPSLPMVKADPNSLQKVFSHLIRNAIKFTPNNGMIRIVGMVALPNPSELPNGGVEIVVSDTGVGVDPALRDMIFTKFYQPGELDKHSTSQSRFKGGGTGLGLALSKGIIEAHGGRIWVDSPGHNEVTLPGSHFHVLLPLSKQEVGTTIPMGKPVNIQIGQPVQKTVS